MTDGVVSAYPQANFRCRSSSDIPYRTTIARERARQRKARLANNPRRMGFQREGRLCKKPFPLACLSSSSFRTSGKKRPPEGVTPAEAEKEDKLEETRLTLPPVIPGSVSDEASKRKFAAKSCAKRGAANGGGVLADGVFGRGREGVRGALLLAGRRLVCYTDFYDEETRKRAGGWRI